MPTTAGAAQGMAQTMERIAYAEEAPTDDEVVGGGRLGRGEREAARRQCSSGCCPLRHQAGAPGPGQPAGSRPGPRLTLTAAAGRAGALSEPPGLLVVFGLVALEALAHAAARSAQGVSQPLARTVRVSWSSPARPSLRRLRSTPAAPA